MGLYPGSSRILCSILVLAFTWEAQAAQDSVLSLNVADSRECEPPSPGEELQSLLQGISATQSQISGCGIHEEVPNYKSIPGLSNFWAQEYTGADLLRESMEFSKKDWNVPRDFIHVLDTNDSALASSDQTRHMDYVSSLIMGTRAAAIPAPVSHLVQRDPELPEDYVSYVESLKKFPRYIAKSTSWPVAPWTIMYSAVAKTTRHGTLWVVAAGNDSEEMSGTVSKVARDLNLIAVSNVSVSGTPHESSNYSSEITIGAPSDGYVLLSYRANGEPLTFGGTSAAQPQVTSALAAFELITGHSLTKDEAVRLLKETAVPTLSSYLQPSKYGAGSLNTYKIGRIAFDLRGRCMRLHLKERNRCYQNGLLDLSSIKFPAVELSAAKTAFPACFAGASRQSAQPSCQKNREAFKQLRSEALLHPNKAELWRALACIETGEGFPKNAKFYAFVADLQTVGKVSAAPLSFFRRHMTSAEIVQHLMTVSPWHDRAAWIEEILAEGTADEEIARFILSDPRWKDRPDWVERIVKSGKADHELKQYALDKMHWRTHPRFVELLRGKPLTSENLRQFLMQPQRH